MLEDIPEAVVRLAAVLTPCESNAGKCARFEYDRGLGSACGLVPRPRQSR